MVLLFTIYMLICSKLELGIFWYDWVLYAITTIVYVTYSALAVLSDRKERAAETKIVQLMEESGDRIKEHSNESEGEEDDRWSSLT